MIRSFTWSFLEQGGAKAVALIVQIVLARLLAPDAFGVLAIMLVITQVADSIAQSGLGLALIQETDANEDSYSTCWWLSLAIALALYIAIVLFAPAIAAFYGMPDLELYLRVLGLVVIANAANSIQRSYLQRSMDFKSIFKVTLFASVASGVAGIGLAIAGAGVWALVAQTLSQGAFTLAAMLVVVPWKPKFVFVAAEARELFRYGWKICVTGVLNVLYTGVSELVIGRACSAGELGMYSQGRKYPQAVIGVASNSIANVLLPAFSAIKGDANALRKNLADSLVLGTFVVAPMSFLLVATAEPIVALLLTEKWLPCVPIFQLACASNSVLMLQLVNLRAYMALGDSSLYLKLQVIKVLFGGGAICATAILTQDIYMTAIATFAVGLLAVLFVDMQPAHRLHGYSRALQLKDTAPTFALSIAAAIAAYTPVLLGIPYLPLLLLQVAVFSLVFLLGARLFHFAELERFRELINGLVGRGKATC